MYKKLAFSLFLAALILLKITPNNASAEEKITTTQELHDLIVKSDLANLDETGQILIDKEASSLNVSEEIYEEYTEDLKELNSGVEQELMYFDENFQIHLLSPEEIVKKVLDESLKNPEERYINENEFDFTDFVTLAAAPPSKNIKNLVLENRKGLDSFYNTAITAQRYGGGDAFTSTVGYFVGKVMPGGAWDYKVVSGYSPWSKEFTGTFFDGTRVINSAYIGNYNYGFTGELLFSKNALLTAGDGVSIITTFMDNAKKLQFKASLDGEDDKIPVRKGYDDAVKYY